MNQKKEQILNEFLNKLKNTEKENPPLAVLFSGVPGSGKTTLAQEVEEKLVGVGIYNREIKETIKKIGRSPSPEERQKIYHEVLYEFIKEYDFKNKFIIVDKSIDRDYKEILKIFKRKKWETLIVRLKISKEKAVENVIKRDGENPGDVKRNMERWFKEWEEFGKNNKWDFLIEQYEGKEELIKKIRTKLSSLRNP